MKYLIFMSLFFIPIAALINILNSKNQSEVIYNHD
jgi:hypothetical protein